MASNMYISDKTKTNENSTWFCCYRCCGELCILVAKNGVDKFIQWKWVCVYGSMASFFAFHELVIVFIEPEIQLIESYVTSSKPKKKKECVQL